MSIQTLIVENTKITRRKIFVKNYQTVWKRMINYEIMFFFLIIQFSLPSRWKFLSVISEFIMRFDTVW